MRLNSLLLVVVIVFFACVDASSTRSGSRSATSDGQNVPVQRFLRDGVETNEERGINLSSLYEVTESVKSFPSKVVVKVLSWILRLSGKSAEDALKFLRLNHPADIKNQRRSIRFDAWVKYAVKTTKAIPLPVIKEVSKHFHDKGLLKLLKASILVGGREADVAKLKTELIGSWNTQKKKTDYVYCILRIDHENDPTLRKALFNVWSQFSIEEIKTKKLTPEEEKANLLELIKELIAPYNSEERVKILKNIIAIKGFEVVTPEVEKLLQEAQKKLPGYV